MLLNIIPLYTCLLTVFYIILCFRVIYLRRLLRVGLGHGDQSQLRRAIRVHGNFQEYVPLSLLIILILELNNSDPILLHFLGSTLLLSRIIHAIGLIKHGGSSPGRFFGTGLNYLMLLVGTIGLSCGLMVLF